MLSWTQILVVVVLIALLFGTGRVSSLMGDVAKGIKSFKKGLADDDDEVSDKPEPKTINAKAEATAQSEKDKASQS
ncbi:MAG: twin-arginine translocase TatA/TatE family subunit [Rhizobiales bacterium]|nr:twin-arginine translocase TatA/TatE family subunit [Hyphomicrobiales bacterium]